MEIISLNEQQPEVLAYMIERLLAQGEVVIGPTDTVYGIFAKADDERAIEKIFAMKRRPPSRALPVFVKDIRMARWHAYISDAKARFLEKMWPGRVTVVFHHKEKLPRSLTGGLDTIGLRIPDHAFLAAVLGRFEVPLAETSANVSDQPPARTVEELVQYFDAAPEKPALIIDGGVLKGQVSTVVNFTGDSPLITRSGMMTKAELDGWLRDIGM